jgi:uncharacterized protein (TIGR02271 family)
MQRRKPTENDGLSEAPNRSAEIEDPEADTVKMLELREEELVAHKSLHDLGDVKVHTEVEEIPGRLEVDAYHEEVLIEHEPVGQIVSERDSPWEEDGVVVIPVYEEQLVATKRLVLKERIHIRRVGTTERQLFQDTLRRERLVVDDARHTAAVRERYPVVDSEHDATGERTAELKRDDAEGDRDSGFLEHLVRKALQ